MKRWLELEGYKVFFTAWNSSVVVKRSTKKGKKRQRLTPTTFALVHCTDFADRYERQVLPMLHAGYIIPALRADFIVLADRYIYTLMARDIVRHVDPEWVKEVYSIALVPDAVFYLKVSPRDLAERNVRKNGSWIIGNQVWISSAPATCMSVSSDTRAACRSSSRPCRRSTALTSSMAIVRPRYSHASCGGQSLAS